MPCEAKTVGKQKILSVPLLLPLSASYAQEVNRLENECFRRPWSFELVKSELNHPCFFGYGLKTEQGEFIAYSLNRLIVDELHILRIGVVPEYRKHGFAKKLMTYVVEEANNKGAQLCFLECRASNSSAKRLYKSCGFDIQGSRRGYYSDNGEDALLLSLNIAENENVRFLGGVIG